jgi:hypothetical protein
MKMMRIYLSKLRLIFSSLHTIVPNEIVLLNYLKVTCMFQAANCCCCLATVNQLTQMIRHLPIAPVFAGWVSRHLEYYVKHFILP